MHERRVKLMIYLNLEHNGVHVSWGAMNGFDEANKSVNMIDMLERPTFRVADTDVSYRRISLYESAGLLPVHLQKNEHSWRTFSIKDYLYLLVLGELKCYGVRNSLLRSIYETFYGDYKANITEAIGCVLGHIEISAMYYSDGTFVVVDMDNAALFEGNVRPHDAFVKISFNKLLKLVLDQTPLKFETFAEQSGAAKVMEPYGIKLSDKEQEALEIIRNEKYTSITIAKNDNILKTINGQSSIDNYSEQKALSKLVSEMISSKNFGDITITKRDGRIVHVANQDTVKL